METKPLPEKLSELVELCIADGQRMLDAGELVIEMGNWGSKDHTTCFACAGGVIAIGRGFTPGEGFSSLYNKVWSEAEHELPDAMHALNELREGRLPSVGLDDIWESDFMRRYYAFVQPLFNDIKPKPIGFYNYLSWVQWEWLKTVPAILREWGL